MFQSVTASPAAAAPPVTRARGNPTLHLIPRCGARTRAGCPCRAPAVRGRQRCRMHGGRSTGPRSPEARQRLREARLLQGAKGAEWRASDFFCAGFARSGRVFRAVIHYRDWLPAPFAARLGHRPPELDPPARPEGGLTVAQDRALRRAHQAALAPWREAIATARQAARAARRTRQPAVAARTPRTLPPGLRQISASEAHAPIPPAGTGAISVSEPLAPIPAADARAAPPPATQAPPAPPRPRGISGPDPQAPGRSAGACAIFVPKAHAPIPSANARGISVPKAHAPIPPPGAHGISVPEPHAPIPAPGMPAGLNRAGRRRWERAQRRQRHPAPATGATRH